MASNYRGKAGQLRDLLDLEKQTLVPDDGAGSEMRWTPVESVWGKVRPASSFEASIMSQRGMEVSHVVTIRYYSGLDATWRFKFDGRYLAVVGVVDVDERQRMMEVKCVERKGKDDQAGS